jgi:hypothetical protein
MITETPQVLKTFRETLAELKGSNKEISENFSDLNGCLINNSEDNPSTKDIFDAVTALRAEKIPPQTHINLTSSLVDNYLKMKKIKPEQSFVNPLEVFANPFGAARNFIQVIEGSMSGLSEESKFVNKILEEILQPRENFDDGQIKNTKKNILKTYFENHDVTYDDFKNLLKINQIDDLKSQNDLFISFLKRGNLDETKFVKNVKDFLQDKEKLPADDKGEILEKYLVYRNEEVTKDKVSALADKIGLTIYPQETIDKVTQSIINFSVEKNQGIKPENAQLESDVVAYRSTASDAKLTRSIEQLVKNINSEIEFRQPGTVVAATASNLGAAPLGR